MAKSQPDESDPAPDVWEEFWDVVAALAARRWSRMQTTTKPDDEKKNDENSED